MKKILLLITLLLISASIFSQDKDITLEDLFVKNKYRIQGYSGMIPLKDGEHYAMRDSLKNIAEFEYKTGEKSKILLDLNDFISAFNNPDISIDEYSFSSDETKLLIATETEALFRHSSISDYYIWDLKAKSIQPLSDKGKQRLATLSPDGLKVGFVRDNNIFIKDLISKKEEQITKDGLRNNIINGAPDWVYEEEFAFGKAFDWSPDGSKIAFMKFDESKVKEYDLTFYGDLYPELFKYKYPKSGEDNSIVTVWIYDINKKSTVKVDVGKNTDQYIPRIKWTKSPDLLSLIRLNRLQNKMDILLANPETGNTKNILTEENNYYLDENYDLTFLKNNSFVRTSEMGGFAHLYHYDINGKLLSQITKGDWEVKRLNGIDETKGVVYYESNEPSVIEKALYSVNLDGSGKKKLSEKTGTYSASYSKNFKYSVTFYSNANTPPEITLKETDGIIIKYLADNNKFKKVMAEKEFVKKEFFKFKTSEGIELNGWMMKPANMDAAKKYPCLMYVYGGPNSQTVSDAYSSMDFVWYQMLCQNGYVVVSVDGRGTGGRDEDFTKCTYLKLGSYDVDDQIEAAKYLGTLDFIDKDRIGIWGWSFGGYMTTMCLTRGADYFKMGVAVAPVTDWRYYDNIYTERFMRTPKENPSGYKDGSPVTYADKLKGKLLIVHGSSDDNVHTQNSFAFIDELIKQNKQFEMQIYPNRNHNISGGNSRYHLYKRMTEFIYRNL